MPSWRDLPELGLWGIASRGDPEHSSLGCHYKLCTTLIIFTGLSNPLQKSWTLQISGGPVYVSDKPGYHDFELLKRLVLSDGTLLRCSQVGRPTLDTLFNDVMRDKKSVLKVQNRTSDFLPDRTSRLPTAATSSIYKQKIKEVIGQLALISWPAAHGWLHFFQSSY